MDTLWQIAAIFLASLGTALLVLAAVGVVRMPDLYTRMQTASKASTLGAGLVLLAVAMLTTDAGTAVRAVLASIFLMMTTPIAAHLIARAACQRKVAFSDDTKLIDMPDGSHTDAPHDASSH